MVYQFCLDNTKITADKLELYGGVTDELFSSFYADVVKRMGKLGELTRDDLYKYSEAEVIWLMRNSCDMSLSKTFKMFQECTKFYESDIKPSDDKYSISFNCKKRYLNPLVNVNGQYKRIYEVSEVVKERIDKFLSFETPKYAYFDFNFKDEKKMKKKKLY